MFDVIYNKTIDGIVLNSIQIIVEYDDLYRSQLLLDSSASVPSLSLTPFQIS